MPRACKARLQSLQDNPNLGKPRNDWFPGCRCYQIEQHLVLYEVVEDAIGIARIFHRRMDPASHF